MVATACVLLGVLLSARATVGRALHPDPHDYFLSRYTRYHTLGNYLAQHACADETVQLEEIGVMGFYGWPVRVRDTNSLIHRDIAPERIGHSGRIAQAHPHDMIVTYNSHGRYFVAHRDGRPCVYERLFESSHTPPNPTLYRRLDQPPENWDFGLFPGEDWGGVIVHWTRTRADVPFVAEGERLRIRYHIGHPDISPTHPVRVTFSVNDAKPRTLTHEATGYFDETIPLADIDATTTATLRLEVNRTWLSQEGRLLGIALFPLICEFEK